MHASGSARVLRFCLAAAMAWSCGSGGGGPATGSGTRDGGGSGAGSDAGAPQPLGGGDWTQYRHDPSGVSANPGIWNATDAPAIAPLWTAEITPETAQGKQSGYVYSQAMIEGDSIFFTTAFSAHVLSVDASTGRTRWDVAYNGPVSTSCGGVGQPGIWGAAAVVEGVVYVPSPDGNLYALSRADGSKLWSQKIADPTPASNGEFVESSPAVSTALGKVYLGVAASHHCHLVRGRVLAVDLAAPHAVTSRPLVGPEQQGAGVWASISIDEAARRIYAASGNRVGPIEEEPLAQSIVALDAITLEVLDHWQNPTPLENADFGSSPALFSARDGTPLIASASKDGWLYVLRRDRLSAGPVWKYQLAVIDAGKPSLGGDPIGGFGSIVSPTFANGLLYAAGGRTPANEPGSVVAFDPASGTVAWKHVTPGYVVAAMPVVGEVLVVESSAAPQNDSSTLEVLDVRNGQSLRQFPRATATYAAPSVGRGLILWTDALGHATALTVPGYRR
jgi:outer membrane protein assembly factor BamB